MPGVIYIKTPLLQKDLLFEKNLSKPPEVEIGAAWYVTSLTELTEAIQAVKAGKSEKLDHILLVQKKISEANDGQATSRVWEQMQKLLEQSQ